MATIKIRVTPIVNKINVRVKEGGIKGDKGNTPIAEWSGTSLGFDGNAKVNLKGEQGIQGISAYQVAIANGFVGIEPQWLEFLRGKNAYELAVINGYVGTQPQWIASLKGEQGNAFVYANFTPEQLALLKGEKGDAFVYSDFTVEQLALLKGATGAMQTPTTFTGTIIPLDNLAGVTKVSSATYDSAFTLGAKIPMGHAVVLISTTGQTVFPTITGATLISGSAFLASKIYEMYVYTLDGTNVKYYFNLQE